MIRAKSNKTITRYRPSFTLSELTEILAALKRDNSAKNVELIRYIDLFIYKSTSGLNAPAYEYSPTATMGELLELGDVPAAVDKRDFVKERLDAYNKWAENPVSCNAIELGRVSTYRYEHSLMSEKEEREYERLMGIN